MLGMFLQKGFVEEQIMVAGYDDFVLMRLRG
jgi:hypothetical protein